MDDEFEDKLFYQTFSSHMKILSKFAVGFSSINSPAAYFWKLCRLYILRPEVIICGAVFLLLLIYIQAIDFWSRSILGRLQAPFNRKTNPITSSISTETTDHWVDVRQQSSAFAILGRRPRMEDRFILEENIDNNTGISFFGVFDGHGGEFAADFAKNILVRNIYNKVIETNKLLKSNSNQLIEYLKHETNSENDTSSFRKRKTSLRNNFENHKENNDQLARLGRRDSFRKLRSTTSECNSTERTILTAKSQKETVDLFTSKLHSLMRNNKTSDKKNFVQDFLINDNSNMQNEGSPTPTTSLNAKCYIENGKINFGKLITDEILAADNQLVEAAKKTTNIAGTTALIAIIQGSKLIVANVGDSRGVMCDSRGLAIPLSFDHKPQQVRERKRIHDAGGFIAFRGVWRVAGILATSRALGDYPLKEKNLVIANPDILTFELQDHKPNFLILASDGLWDTFSNEEACTFILEHITETDFGAKSLALESYQRGSVDNITVLIIVFKNGHYYISSLPANSGLRVTTGSL